jgi:hypothetical protein
MQLARAPRSARSRNELDQSVVGLLTTALAPGLKTFASFADALTRPLADKVGSALEALPLSRHAAHAVRIAPAIKLAAQVRHAWRLGRTHSGIIAHAAALKGVIGRRRKEATGSEAAGRYHRGGVRFEIGRQGVLLARACYAH